MRRHSLATRRSFRHRHAALRQPFLFLPVAAILWVVGAPGGAFGQIREERELDEPPMDQPAEPSEETRPDLSEVVQKIVDRTNEFRRKHDRKPVAPNGRLTKTAQYFADFMARTGKYGHTADKKTPAERAEEHEYEYCMVSENIAYQFRSTGFAADELAEGFSTGWQESPGHRENMLDPDVLEIGVAVARAEDAPTYFAVQMFGRPDSAAISFQVSNESETEVEYTVRRSGSDRTFPLKPKQRRSHQRCRPTTIEFRDPDTTLDVEDGARYVVRQTPDGSLEVANRPSR
jgi:uncharacterized protein YkwD